MTRIMPASKTMLWAVVGAIASFGGEALAQEYPVRPVTIVVPFPAGGPVDATARLIAAPLSEKLGKPFIVENIGGAGTSIGSLKVARATPDGHTLLVQNLALAATGVLYPQSGLDPATNFATVSFLASNPLALVGRKALAANTLPELTAWMKGNRAKVAHPGVGTTGHLTSVVMAKRLGVEIDLVPYRGAAPAMQDVVAGHVDLFIGTPLSVADLVGSGAIKGYGVTSKNPVPQMPKVASLTTISPDLEVQFWTGMFATVGTPKAVIEKLNGAIDQIIASEAVAKVWKTTDQQAYSKADRSPARGDEILRAEVKRWSGLVRENNIKAD